MSANKIHYTMHGVALILFILLFPFLSTPQERLTWKQSGEQLRLLHDQVVREGVGRKLFPRTFDHDSLQLVTSGDWTSGFWPGILWLMYERTGKGEWKNWANGFTVLMERESKNRSSHDVGFKVYTSYGNGYRLTGNETYKEKIIEGARTLCSRYNARVGCIRSWDFPQWQFPVIIDNMMNLEILFAATRLSHDSSFYRVAIAHANTTLKNHFRADHSSYHVVDYDTITGKVIRRMTHQGYADESAWARGQAWGLYGYTMCFRETGDSAYLEQAEAIAAYLLNHPGMPPDKVPYWDFDVAGRENQSRDASAAAVMASALYELRNYSLHAKRYERFADEIMNSLTRHYRARVGAAGGFILLHSTGNRPAGGEIDVPIIYADYYFLEALLRKQKVRLSGKTVNSVTGH